MRGGSLVTYRVLILYTASLGSVEAFEQCEYNTTSENAPSLVRELPLQRSRFPYEPHDSHTPCG
jgi:hypothetical protein